MLATLANQSPERSGDPLLAGVTGTSASEKASQRLLSSGGGDVVERREVSPESSESVSDSSSLTAASCPESLHSLIPSPPLRAAAAVASGTQLQSPQQSPVKASKLRKVKKTSNGKSNATMAPKKCKSKKKRTRGPSFSSTAATAMPISVLAKRWSKVKRKNVLSKGREKIDTSLVSDSAVVDRETVNMKVFLARMRSEHNVKLADLRQFTVSNDDILHSFVELDGLIGIAEWFEDAIGREDFNRIAEVLSLVEATHFESKMTCDAVVRCKFVDSLKGVYQFLHKRKAKAMSAAKSKTAEGGTHEGDGGSEEHMEYVKMLDELLLRAKDSVKKWRMKIHYESSEKRKAQERKRKVSFADEKTLSNGRPQELVSIAVFDSSNDPPSMIAVAVDESIRRQTTLESTMEWTKPRQWGQFEFVSELLQRGDALPPKRGQASEESAIQRKRERGHMEELSGGIALRDPKDVDGLRQVLDSAQTAEVPLQPRMPPPPPSGGSMLPLPQQSTVGSSTAAFRPPPPGASGAPLPPHLGMPPPMAMPVTGGGYHSGGHMAMPPHSLSHPHAGGYYPPPCTAPPMPFGGSGVVHSLPYSTGAAPPMMPPPPSSMTAMAGGRGVGGGMPQMMAPQLSAAATGPSSRKRSRMEQDSTDASSGRPLPPMKRMRAAELTHPPPHGAYPQSQPPTLPGTAHPMPPGYAPPHHAYHIRGAAPPLPMSLPPPTHLGLTPDEWAHIKYMYSIRLPPPQRSAPLPPAPKSLRNATFRSQATSHASQRRNEARQPLGLQNPSSNFGRKSTIPIFRQKTGMK